MLTYCSNFFSPKCLIVSICGEEKTIIEFWVDQENDCQSFIKSLYTRVPLLSIWKYVPITHTETQKYIQLHNKIHALIYKNKQTCPNEIRRHVLWHCQFLWLIWSHHGWLVLTPYIQKYPFPNGPFWVLLYSSQCVVAVDFLAWYIWCYSMGFDLLSINLSLCHRSTLQRWSSKYVEEDQCSVRKDRHRIRN